MGIFKKKDNVSLEEFERMKKYLHEELKRKDKIIEELNRKNELILKSALRQSERTTDMTSKIKELEKKLK